MTLCKCCQINTFHAIHYKTIAYVKADGTLVPERQGSCLICPICDFAVVKAEQPE